MPNFTIHTTPRNTWYFELRDRKGALLLTGITKPTETACQGSVLSTKLNARYKDNFEIRSTPTKEFYVALVSMGTQELLAVSSLYLERNACEELVNRVREEVG